MPATKNQKLSALWVIDPEQAIRLVSKVISTNEGDVTASADALRVSRATLKRWISENDELQQVLFAARTRRRSP